MIHYPLQFQFSSQATSGISQPWEASSPFEDSSPCAIPPEFEGPGHGFSPEDFFGLAVINCFIATFKVIAERSKLEFSNIQARGTLVVDRDDQGVPWMKSMDIGITLQLGSLEARERALRLLEKTASSCLVARSIKTEVHFNYDVSA